MTKFTDKQIEETIRQAGDRFTLSAGEKTDMRFALMDVMKSDQVRTNRQHISHILNPRRLVMPLFPIIFAIVLALGGGTASLANSAKPGDTLYPIDKFIEKIQEKLTANPEVRTKLLSVLADERVKELEEIHNIDTTKLTEIAKQKWEEHRQEAIDRVTTSIAKVTANQDKFKERLASETDAGKKAVLQKIITHLDEVKAKREARLTALQSKTFPGLSTKNLKEAFKQAREDHKDELEKIREQAKQEWEDFREARKQERDNDSSSDDNEDDEDKDDNQGDDNPKPKPCDAEHTIPDPKFPGLCYGNNSLIESGVNTVNQN